jgi:hypothetical protein
MHPYTVKNYLWLVVTVLFIVVALSGCASNTRKVTALDPQYCYTNQEIDLEDGKKVSSRTRIECTDDRTRQLFQARSGIAKDCYEFTYAVNRRGQLVEERGYACQKFSGNYEVFNPSQHR